MLRCCLMTRNWTLSLKLESYATKNTRKLTRMKIKTICITEACVQEQQRSEAAGPQQRKNQNCYIPPSAVLTSVSVS